MTASTSELLTMNQAASRLSTTRTTLYRWLREGRLAATKVGRQWRFKEADLDRFLAGDTPEINLPADIGPFLQSLRERLNDPSPATSFPLSDAVKLMVEVALEAGARSLHLASSFVEQSQQTETWFRIRVDGALQLITSLDSRLMKPLIAEWKRTAMCYPDETKHPQDGRVILSSEKSSGKELVDLRVSFLPTAFGEVLTVCIADRSGARLNLSQLPLSDLQRAQLRKRLRRRGLVIVVAGTPGSARDGVLAACLRELAGPALKLFTVENPAWEFLPWTTQVSTRHMPKGRKAAATVGSILRSDPDVIGVPEIAESETLKQVQRAALEGALVLAGVRAESALGALEVLSDLEETPSPLTHVLELVLSQRLIRNLCPNCKQPHEIESPTRDILRSSALEGGLEPNQWGDSFSSAEGCDQCGGSGYRGRTMLVEVLPLSRTIKKRLKAGGAGSDILELAVAEGLVSIDAQTLALVSQGTTSLEEAERFGSF